MAHQEIEESEMRRTWYWIGCSVLGALLMLGCGSNDQKSANENALGENDPATDPGTAGGPGGTNTQPVGVKPGLPCMKVCLVNGFPWPAPMPTDPGKSDPTLLEGGQANAPAANGVAGTANGAPLCDPDPNVKNATGCVMPPVPPPTALKCMDFCAPGPGCKLVCDPFGVQPLPPVEPKPNSNDPSAPVATGVTGTAIPFLPLCSWQCPPPPPPCCKCAANDPACLCGPLPACDPPKPPPVPCCKSICPDASKPCPAVCDPNSNCAPPPVPCCKSICADPTLPCPAVCDPSATCK
jgi:hypothetical protein